MPSVQAAHYVALGARVVGLVAYLHKAHHITEAASFDEVGVLLMLSCICPGNLVLGYVAEPIHGLAFTTVRTASCLFRLFTAAET